MPAQRRPAEVWEAVPSAPPERGRRSPLPSKVMVSSEETASAEGVKLGPSPYCASAVSSSRRTRRAPGGRQCGAAA